MVKWKNLRNNPPDMDCNICVRVGTDYETYRFETLSSVGWSLSKYMQTIDSQKVPEHAEYIILDNIQETNQ